MKCSKWNILWCEDFSFWGFSCDIELVSLSVFFLVMLITISIFWWKHAIFRPCMVCLETFFTQQLNICILLIFFFLFRNILFINFFFKYPLFVKICIALNTLFHVFWNNILTMLYNFQLPSHSVEEFLKKTLNYVYEDEIFSNKLILLFSILPYLYYEYLILPHQRSLLS